MSVYLQKVRDAVRLLRVAGLSLGQIQKQTNVPKTTIQLWTRGIVQSEEQKELIRKNVLVGLQEGRIVAQSLQKQTRVAKEKSLFLKGVNEIGELTQRELHIAGVALYWAEGFKNRHEHRLGFCNSDPNMIKFYLRWLDSVLGVDKQDIVLRLALNFCYKDKTEDILLYWVRQLDISVSQFTKTFYQKSQWKKQYNNDRYYGVLRVHVKNSLDYLLKMKGWISGLENSLPG